MWLRPRCNNIVRHPPWDDRKNEDGQAGRVLYSLVGVGGQESVTAGAFHQTSTTNQGKDDERTSWTTIRTHIKAAIHLRDRTAAEAAVTGGAAAEEEGAIAGAEEATTAISGKVPHRS